MSNIYYEVQGDVIDIAMKETAYGRHVIIPHVCNTAGVMGAGVARALVEKWPTILQPYRDLLETYTEHPLGHVAHVDVLCGKQNITVANMIAQDGFGRTARPPIRYIALGACMDDVHGFASNTREEPIIVAPMFGSGLAGGDWAVIKLMIHEAWLDAGIDVTICKL